MSQSAMRQSQWRSSSAYTLLELMLALSLLGALMTVAWSLMGTFGKAEQRGWKLSHRIQTIRAARQWLQNDVQHLLQPDLDPAIANANRARFNGNSLGFTASVSPSIDPLPFLEHLMTHPLDRTNSDNEVVTAASLYSDNDVIVEQARSSLWPPESMEIEYKLTPEKNSSAVDESFSTQSAAREDVQFSLTRRELLDINAAQKVSSPAINTPQRSIVSERVLTAQDLYRQTDETSESKGLAIRETRLEGLTNVQFQYFDGRRWRPEWNSLQAGGLPRAIALCFDFPARADMKPHETVSKPGTSSGENPAGLIDSDKLLSSEPLGAMSFADVAFATEPTVTSSSPEKSSLMQNSACEVQLIVYVGGRSPVRDNGQPFVSQRDSQAQRGFE